MFLFPLLSILFTLTPLIHAQNNTIPLHNNQIGSYNLSLNLHQTFYFQSNQAASLLAKRSSAVFLTITTCTQPQSSTKEPVPALQLFVSSTNPLPSASNHDPISYVQQPGYLAWNTTDITRVWITVAAPASGSLQGQWSYELGFSTSALMHPLYPPNQLATLDDTDTTHALFLSTPYLTSTNFSLTPLLTTSVPAELNASYCAAVLHNVASTANVTLANRSSLQPSYAQQQIMVGNLSLGQSYAVYFAQSQPNNVRALQLPFQIQTKSDPRCRLIYQLPFCNNVAYSVLANASLDIWNVTLSYDTNANTLYEPFASAISQFNCHSTQYSLVRNCSDCERDYKRWLCSVAIPRCTDPPADSSEVATYPYPAGTARSSWIQTTYAPNGYTEFLPCIDLCYQVVQSCPPFLQFNCPTDDLAALQYGYWLPGHSPTCNRLDLDPSLLVISRASPRWIVSPLSYLAFVSAWLLCHFL
ncbi:hypothetical protein DM01DRAFT_1333437 [Hesseltinella vesiculosa]|uniref:FZ domain-containing protein n=1 Tax=Hesseltinella vesiculosa TaxID=101127 RepID=A0A1X2GPY7_9FUNG|nr:hypothetical protein DM01DRAFT_1333437 [Hesseltinella vesiculosa]